MSCEAREKEVIALTDAHSQACRQLDEFTTQYLELAARSPLLLVNGQKETLLSYSRRAEHLARLQGKP